MSTSRDMDRLVQAWLELGPTQLSDVALDKARAEVHQTRQRRVIRVAWRAHMSQSSRVLVAACAALAAVVLVGVGLRLAAGPGPVGDPVPNVPTQPSVSAPPAATPSPSVAVSPSPTRSPTTTVPAIYPTMPKLASEGPLQLLWKVSGPTPKGVATGTPAVDPTGRVWVPSGFESRFWIFSADGKYLESWGSPGAGSGQFDFVDRSGSVPRAYGGIAFAQDGSFWVADTGNHRAQHFDESRTFIESIETPGLFDTPVAVALNDGGDVYVDDAGRREIQEFNPSLAHIVTFASGVAGPYLNQEGHGWIDTNALPNGSPGSAEYRPDGSYQGSLDLSAICTYPAGMARDPDHNQFFACMSGSGADAQPEGLIMADETGTGLHLWTTGGAGIAIPPTGGAIYITTPSSSELRKYTLPAP